MSDLDARTIAVLERAAPSFDGERGDWARVLADASRPLHHRRRILVTLAAALAGLVVVLAWPDGTAPPGRVLDRALAATGTGEVFHAVFEADAPGTLLDLRSGEQRRLRATRELWFHPSRGLRTVLRVEGATAGERVQTVDRIGSAGRRLYEAFTTNYREALASGLAKVVDDGELEGRDVYWVQVYSESVPAKTPDLDRLRIQQLAELVAVDAETFKPVYVRQTLDGEPVGAGLRILQTNSVPAEAVRFGPARLYEEGLGYGESLQRDLAAAEARRRLTTPALWAGPEIGALPLGRIVELDFEEGRGPFENWTVTRGLAVAYGQVTPSGQPDARAPYVWIRQSPRRLESMSAYVPAEGTALVSDRGAFLVREGTYVTIEASSQDLAIAAARALRAIGS